MVAMVGRIISQMIEMDVVRDRYLLAGGSRRSVTFGKSSSKG
jgi:hypothetical protein